jgi:hypothetical protein
MLGGMIATVVWQNTGLSEALLDIKAAAVLISAVLVVSVSLMTSPPNGGTDSVRGS